MRQNRPASSPFAGVTHEGAPARRISIEQQLLFYKLTDRHHSAWLSVARGF